MTSIVYIYRVNLLNGEVKKYICTQYYQTKVAYINDDGTTKHSAKKNGVFFFDKDKEVVLNHFKEYMERLIRESSDGLNHRRQILEKFLKQNNL